MKKHFSLILPIIATIALSFSNHGHRKQIILSGYAMAKEGGAANQVLVGVRGTTVACYSNEQGYYQLNITEVVDTCKTFSVIADNVNFKRMIFLFNYKIKKSTAFNFEMINIEPTSGRTIRITVNKKNKRSVNN